jgi:putative FmdB family regulatory protein
MPTYDHECYECGHAWEDFYSINKEPPTECPECGGKARRVITTIPVCKVVLTGRELKQHIKEERRKIKEQIKTDENFRANITGEEAHHNTQVNVKKIGEDLNQI